MTEPTYDGPAPTNVDEALHALQGMGITVRKSAEGQNRQGKTDRYADLVEFNRTVLAALNALGCIWKCRPTLIEGGEFVLTYSLKHVASGTAEEGNFPIPKGASQAMGSSITYARRYALGAVTGVAAEDEDDDGRGYAGRGGGMAQRSNVRQERSQPAPTAQRAAPAPRAERAQPAQRPVVPEPQRADLAPVRGGEMPTDAMKRKFFAQLREAGIGGDDGKLFVGTMLGRGGAINSTNEITFTEMRGIIDAFEKALKDPATARDTVVEIYQRASGPAPTAEQAELGHPPAKRAAPAKKAAAAAPRSTRESIVGTENPNGEAAPWEMNEPPPAE